MVELSHLRYFVALAEELHFGRAAARLHMAQPPLTRQIKLLEERLNCRLFERNSRGTRLTPAGEQLLDRARAILAEAARAVEATRRLGRGEEGRLTLATAPSLMLGPLPRTIRSFRRKYPSLDFRLTEMASSAILEAVRNGAADLGLLRGADQDPAVRTQIRWKEPMVAILPSDFAASESPLAPARLRNQPFVFFSRHLGPSFYDETIAWCRRAGFVPQVTQEARQWSSIMSLVAAGMGVSIGPESIAGLMPRAVRCLPLQGFTTTVRLVSRTGEPAPAVQNFVRIAGEALRYN